MSFKTKLIKHLPEILTGLGIGSMITGTIMAIKMTPRAEQRLKECAPKDEKKQRAKDICIKVVPCYGVPIALEIGGAVLISMALGKCIKRNAALSVLLAGAESTIELTNNKIAERFGKEVADEINKDVQKEKIRHMSDQNTEVYYPDKISNGQLYIDSTTGRKFVLTPGSLRDRVNNLNMRIMSEHDIQLNEYYYAIGLPTTSLGEYLYFFLDDGLITIDDKTSIVLESGESAILVDFVVKPRMRDRY